MDDITVANSKIKELFTLLNKKFYHGCLPDVPIFLTATTRSITSFNPDVTTVFNRKRKQECQFNFSDDILTDSVTVACTRLLHVMCHYYCYLHNIPETSRGGTYHNKRFMYEAEKHGLIQVKDDKYGYSISCPSKALAQFCANELKDFSFDIFRYTHYNDEEKNLNRNSHSIKRSCPYCGNNMRATKQSYLYICGNCLIEKYPQIAKEVKALFMK